MQKLPARSHWIAGLFAAAMALPLAMPTPAVAASDLVQKLLAQRAAKKAAVAQARPTYAGFARGRLLVRPRVGVAETDVQESLRGLGFRSRMLMRRLNVQVLELPAGVDEVAAMKLLQQSGKYAFAELDMAMAPAEVVSDPQFGSSWALPKIGAQAAWDFANGTGVTVAVLDTGVLSSHPDLAANMVPGWNTYDNDANSADVQGHGTMVAGVIGMVGNNGVGSAGIAYGSKIMPIRITDTQGYGYFSTMAAGIYWAADHGARVANISFSGVAGSSSVAAAAQYMRNLGGQVVVAAGNTGAELAYSAYDTLIVAGATDSADARASFSSWGSFVDVGAPGVSIYTTNRSGSYSNASGTSFASPVTAAVVALMMSANPALAASDLDTLLFTGVKDLGAAGKDVYFGHGRIDAGVSVAAASVFNRPDVVAPTVSMTGLVVGAVLKDLVNVDVSATDDRGVTGVELYLDGVRIADDIAAPYAFSLDTKQYSEGNQTLEARAVDAAGNVGRSTLVAFTIQNVVTPPPDTVAPVVSGFTLSNGLTLTQASYTIAANASDNVGVTRMEISLGGVVFKTATASSISHTLLTADVPTGTWVYGVCAYDAAGNKHCVSASVTKPAPTTPTGDTTAPVVNGFNLVDGFSLTGSSFAVSASATDNVKVTKMEVWHNGRAIYSTTRSALKYTLRVAYLAFGTHLIEIRAYDKAGNVGTVAASTVKLAPPPDTTAPVISQFNLMNGMILKGSSFSVTAAASDNDKVVRMEVWHNGQRVLQASRGNVKYVLRVSALVAGTHSVEIRAYDKAGNMSQRAVNVQKVATVSSRRG